MTSRRSLRRIGQLLLRHRKSYLAGLGMLLLVNAAGLATAGLLKLIFDALAHEGGAEIAAWAALTIAVLAAFRGLARTASRLAILGNSRTVCAELRRDIFDHLLGLPTDWHDRTPTGDIVSRMINDMRFVRSLFGPVAMNLANTLFLYVMALAVLLRIDPLLTVLSLSPYLLCAGVIKRNGARAHRESMTAQEALGRISTHLSETLSGITVVKTHRREEAEGRRFDAFTDEYYEANRRFAHLRAIVVPFVGLAGSLGTLAILGLGGLRVMDGRFSVGDFVAFIYVLMSLAWPAVALGWVLNAFQRGLAAMDRIDGLLQEPLEEQAAHPKPALLSTKGVEFRHCTFRHESGVEPALRDVSFKLAAGQRLGIVGETGSGKSTLMDLMTGLLLPDRGQVFLGGEDVLDIDRRALRRETGAVPQGAFLFSKSLRDNVEYSLLLPEEAGGRVLDETRLDRAVADAGLTKDLAQLPKGLDTLIGERGVTLSGGQRQRAALARALVREPGFLLLDDPLSAVDAQTEREILKALGERRKNSPSTEVIVSHRLSVVANCDLILVLSKGRIIERGRHEDLLALGGVYARTFEEQELRRELSGGEG